MRLSDYAQILWVRKGIILVTSLVTVAVVIIGLLLIPTTYKAVATLRVVPPTRGSSEYVQLLYADRIMNTYVELASSNHVVAELRSRLGFEEPPKIDVEVIPETDLLRITVRDTNPALARDTANALADILISQRVVRETTVTVVEPAVTPKPPTVLSWVLYIAAGLLTGLSAGMALVFFFENLDTRLYTPDQIEDLTGLPIVGRIPSLGGSESPSSAADGWRFQMEAFHRLRMNLLARTDNNPPGVVLVTSAKPGDGKSTVVAHLASSLARSGRSVIAIDTDLRRPSLHKRFGAPNEVGLSSILAQGATIAGTVTHTEIEDLRLLTSGPLSPNPADLLSSKRMQEIISELKNEFDAVLIDTPAILAVVDTAVLAPLADIVLLVVELGRSSRSAVQSALEQLRYLGISVDGVVVNRVGPSSSYYAYYRYYGNGSAQKAAIGLPGVSALSSLIRRVRGGAQENTPLPSQSNGSSEWAVDEAEPVADTLSDPH